VQSGQVSAKIEITLPEFDPPDDRWKKTWKVLNVLFEPIGSPSVGLEASAGDTRFDFMPIPRSQQPGSGLPKTAKVELVVEDPIPPPPALPLTQQPIGIFAESPYAESPSEVLKGVREKINYVFVIYQENRSFDSYFGTFPGADGLFSRPPEETPGFYQELIDINGSPTTVHPFRIGPAEYAADTDDIDHLHSSIIKKMNIQGGIPRMDKFAVTEEEFDLRKPSSPLAAKQFGELAMAYEDCDTVPLLWAYADKFVLFDHIFQLMAGPSTPGNLAIIGAQSGVTQWILHPEEEYTGNGDSGPGVPVLNDARPFWGSAQDTSSERMPYNPKDRETEKDSHYKGPQKNLTFATLPLTLKGGDLRSVVDLHPKDHSEDLDDVREDVDFISDLTKASVPFGWYQEGYDDKPVKSECKDDPVDANGIHASYVTHHNGPQYFGYIANNPKMREQLYGLDDFLVLLKKRPRQQNGVFYVKGGYRNMWGLRPAHPSPAVQCDFRGDDDHPGYSDAQISEIMVARAINAIAESDYWPQSAIIITWDDSEGDYDHVPPPIRAFGPDGSAIIDGPRVPLILISPYAQTHYVAHETGNHASVVKFIDAVFNLPQLALLPDESRARLLGQQKFGRQTDLGPEDALTADVTDLLGAFDPARLKGTATPLPKSYVKVDESLFQELPQKTGYGCKDLGITTTDRALGVKNAVPIDFNPLPKTVPTPTN
jgi:phospholipase C